MRVEYHLHRHVVDDLVFGFELWILRSNMARDFKEQAAGVLENVGLVHSRDFLPLMRTGVLIRVFDNACRTRTSHNSYRLGSASGWIDVMLDAGVKLFCVFPNDNQINILVAGLHALEGSSRPEVYVQLVLLPERNIDAAET